MSTDKSNKKEPDNGLYTLLTAGQSVTGLRLAVNLLNEKI